MHAQQGIEVMEMNWKTIQLVLTDRNMQPLQDNKKKKSI